MEEGEGDKVARQLVENELRFREANEKIEGAAILLEGAHYYPFVCECGHMLCYALLRLTIEEYEHARSNPLWFLHAPGHEIAGDTSEVVEDYGRYQIVEKHGLAAKIAEAKAAQEPRRVTS